MKKFNTFFQILYPHLLTFLFIPMSSMMIFETSFLEGLTISISISFVVDLIVYTFINAISGLTVTATMKGENE